MYIYNTERKRERERERVPLKNVLSNKEGEKGRSTSWYLVFEMSSFLLLPMFQPNKLHGLMFLLFPHKTLLFDMQ